MNTTERIQVLHNLQEYLKNIDPEEKEELFLTSANENTWFDKFSMENAFNGVIHMLDRENLEKLCSGYKNQTSKAVVGIVCAGNIPGVCFQDMVLSFLFSGKTILKLSSTDSAFPKYLLEKMIFFNPEVEKLITLKEQLNLDELDGVIATGSDNTARYFEKYFSKIPSVIRKNRTSLAVLDGTETPEQIEKLGKDIFTYYGLGCRNVSKILVPKDFDFVNFLDNLEIYKKATFNHRYSNNYDYNRSVYLVNREHHYDNGFLMLKESPQLVSPISVLFYEFFESETDIENYIKTNKEKIQVVVSDKLENVVGFGQAQKPAITDFPDNVNVVDFILSL